MNKLFFEGQCKRETSDCKSPEQINTSIISEESQARLSSAECSLNSIFYQLIQVSLGTRICLSHTPSASEWGELYAMAKKQSLVGVCFAGVQRLQSQKQEPPEMLYLTWMGMAAKIQQRNEVVNKQCGELTEKFRKDGYDVVVLKGQSAAERYKVSEGFISTSSAQAQGYQKVSDLSLLRQSGDIDAWVSGSREEIKKYITKNYHVGEVIYNHAHVEVFSDTEVEVHFTPSWLYSPFRNLRLQEWFSNYKVSDASLVSKGFMFHEDEGFKSPSVEFDLVYLMLHAYRHLMHEGLGLRQVMDYYMVLRTVSDGFRVSEGFKSVAEFAEVQEVSNTLKSLGLMKFAGAMMYVIKVVFGFDEMYMICEPNKERGERLLQEIMRGGNMGRGDDRTGKSKTRVGYFWEHVSRQWSFMRDYPSEVLWSPLWKIWHFLARKSGWI